MQAHPELDWLDPLSTGAYFGEYLNHLQEKNRDNLDRLIAELDKRYPDKQNIISYGLEINTNEPKILYDIRYNIHYSEIFDFSDYWKKYFTHYWTHYFIHSDELCCAQKDKDGNSTIIKIRHLRSDLEKRDIKYLIKNITMPESTQNDPDAIFDQYTYKIGWLVNDTLNSLKITP